VDRVKVARSQKIARAQMRASTRAGLEDAKNATHAHTYMCAGLRSCGLAETLTITSHLLNY